MTPLFIIIGYLGLLVGLGTDQQSLLQGHRR